MNQQSYSRTDHLLMEFDQPSEPAVQPLASFPHNP